MNTNTNFAPAAGTASASLRLDFSGLDAAGLDAVWLAADELRAAGVSVERGNVAARSLFRAGRSTWVVVYGADELDVRSAAVAAGWL